MYTCSLSEAYSCNWAICQQPLPITNTKYGLMFSLKTGFKGQVTYGTVSRTVPKKSLMLVSSAVTVTGLPTLPVVGESCPLGFADSGSEGFVPTESLISAVSLASLLKSPWLSFWSLFCYVFGCRNSEYQRFYLWH